MPRPLPEASRVRSIALAKSPLPSARKSMLSAPVAFFQASMTNTSLTDVSAPVELVETGHDLDCEIARDGGEGDGDAFVRHSRRCAVEREGEALQADGSAIDRFRHRQRPIR